MAVFSTNQVRHLYVANSYKADVVATDAEGTIGLKTDKAKNHLYFQYKGVGSIMRSDLIDPKNIIYAAAKDADCMEYALKQVTVTLDSDVNDGEPISGQDYILRLAFKAYLGMSEEDQYFKYGAVHAVSKMTASKFYATMAVSLAKNFSREVYPLVKFYLTTESDEVEVNPLDKVDDLTGTYTSLVIREVEQDWHLGTMPVTHVDFNVVPTTVTYEGDEVVWGKAVKADSTTKLNNGKLIADMEYFYMGERGDQYRNIGWPNVIPTKYLVDPSKAYYTIDIHYAYVGDNEGVQKSEKDITIVSADKAVITSIVNAFNTATGMEVAIVNKAGK